MKKIGIFVLLVFGVVELLTGQLHQKESELEVGKLPDMVLSLIHISEPTRPY